MEIRTKYDLFYSPSRGSYALAPKEEESHIAGDWVPVMWSRKNHARAKDQALRYGLLIFGSTSGWYDPPPAPPTPTPPNSDLRGRGKNRDCDVVRWLQAYGGHSLEPEDVMLFELFDRSREACAQALAGAFNLAGRGNSPAGLLVDLEKTDIVGTSAYDVSSQVDPEDGSLWAHEQVPNIPRLGRLAMHGKLSSIRDACRDYKWSGHSEVWLGKRREYKGIVIVSKVPKIKAAWKALARSYGIPIVPFHSLKISSGHGIK